MAITFKTNNMRNNDPYKKIKLTEKERTVQFLAIAVAAAMMFFFFVKILFL
ncbi:MAG: hypothetical protein ACI8YQ_002323 [Polaribacter sp.]